MNRRVIATIALCWVSLFVVSSDVFASTPRGQAQEIADEIEPEYGSPEYVMQEIKGDSASIAIVSIGGVIAAWIGLKFVRTNDLKSIRQMNSANVDQELESDIADQIAMYRLRQTAGRRPNQ